MIVKKPTTRTPPNPKGTPGNLLDLSKLDKETKRKMASNGGKKAQAMRKEKKLLSELYTKAIADMYEESDELNLPMIIKKVLARADSSSVALLKEIREATEGSKVALSGDFRVQEIKRIIIDAKPGA